VQANKKVDFEKYKAKGEQLEINVIGLLHLADDVPASLASQVIESMQGRGVF
jgi:Ribbon-Helix-Helix transcriptional regulator family